MASLTLSLPISTKPFTVSNHLNSKTQNLQFHRPSCSFLAHHNPKNNDNAFNFWACEFRDSYEKFKKAGAEVMLEMRATRSEKSGEVLSDLFGTLPGRDTYILDKNGVVQLVYNNQFQPEKHIIDETLKLLQSLK